MSDAKPWMRTAVLATLLAVSGLAACERRTPIERIGDEAVDSVTRGEQWLATRVDDAVDDLRD